MVEHVEGTDESTVDKDSSVPLVHHDMRVYLISSWSWSNLGLNNPRSNFDKGKIKPV